MPKTDYPDRYIITAKVNKDSDRGGVLDVKRGTDIYLYWSEEGGGWWQWSTSQNWAYRFQSLDDPKLKGALKACPNMGPWYNYPDPSTIQVINVPAIVKVY